MNKLKKYIISILLLTFTFFILHGYFIEDLSYDAQYEQTSNEKRDINKLALTIHDNIHTMFEITLEEANPIAISTCNNKPTLIDYIFISFIIFPIDKPPTV